MGRRRTGTNGRPPAAAGERVVTPADPDRSPQTTAGGAMAVESQACMWRQYPSINGVELEQVEKIRLAVQGKGIEFVAVEKVHGSNFAFETDGQSISYFSRTRRLVPEEKFVGRSAPADAMSRYHKAVAETFRLCSSFWGARHVVVYGEYFGGWFPHEGIRQEGPGAGVPVQKGIVAYAPDHNFFAFDVNVDGIFLDFDDAHKLLRLAGFPLVAEPLFRGSFEECMALDIEQLQTGIPALLGLPLCDNFSTAEGLVIRPVRRCESWTVKRKSVRYLEAVPAELRKWLGKCVESRTEAFVGLYLSLCRPARLDAVLSKDPQLRAKGEKSLPTVQELFRKDVQEAFDEALSAGKIDPPTGGLDAAYAEADRRVVAWLFGPAAELSGA